MKCWRLKTVYPNGAVDIDFYNSLLFALSFANCWKKEFNATCSIMYADWSTK